MNLHHRVHIFIIRIWEQNDFHFNGIAISNKVELRLPYPGQVMDFPRIIHLLTEIPKHMEDHDVSFCEDLLPWSDKLPAECRK